RAGIALHRDMRDRARSAKRVMHVLDLRNPLPRGALAVPGRSCDVAPPCDARGLRRARPAHGWTRNPSAPGLMVAINFRPAALAASAMRSGAQPSARFSTTERAMHHCAAK